VNVRKLTRSSDGDSVPHWMLTEQAGRSASGGARVVRVERPDAEGAVKGSMAGRRVGSRRLSDFHRTTTGTHLVI
jgi:hypothetical protein